MSNSAFGVILFNGKLTYSQLTEVSFNILKYAIENKINISLLNNKVNHLVGDITYGFEYQLTDNPFTINSEIMFAGDGVKVFENSRRTDNGESLFLRMQRLQNAFKGILNITYVKEIVFYLLECDSTDLSEVDYKLEVDISNLCSTICNIYAIENQRTPDLEITLKNL